MILTQTEFAVVESLFFELSGNSKIFPNSEDYCW